ncbi:MAG: hypothetical protein QOI42_1941, partial [Frankiaceae bacterium]|nr:hypothetical protein [Frankiaceae bacterium]
MSRRRVVHVVRSSSFAGVERYVADTAAELHDRGWDVVVIGGDAQRMRAELPADLDHLPGDSLVQVVRSLSTV